MLHDFLEPLGSRPLSEGRPFYCALIFPCCLSRTRPNNSHGQPVIRCFSRRVPVQGEIYIAQTQLGEQKAHACDNAWIASAKIRRMTNLDIVVKQLQEERQRIDEAIQILSSLNGTAPKASQPRTMSASARRRIAVAQRARWAKQKTASQNTERRARSKRKISAAGIARIRAAAKARWARVRSAKK